LPAPYAPNVIGIVEFPDEPTTKDSCHVSPLLNKIASPGLNEVYEFTLDMVLQGVEGERPLLLSFPVVALT
jgi:proline-rich tail region repeat protein